MSFSGFVIEGLESADWEQKGARENVPSDLAGITAGFKDEFIVPLCLLAASLSASDFRV
jgi:hypothetical protein